MRQTALKIASVLLLVSGVALSFQWRLEPGIGTPPEPRYGHVLVQHSGSLYAWGGTSANVGDRQPLEDVWRWDGSRWRRLELLGSEVPPPLRYSAAQAINGSLWVFGGYQQDGLLSAELYEYSFSLSRWRHVQPASAQVPVHRGYAHSCVKDGKLVVYAGYGVSQSAPLGDLWTWDPTTAVWTLLSNTGPKRSGGFMTCEGDDMILWSGSNSWLTSSPELWIYNFPSNTWTLKAQLGTIPTPRYSGCSVSYGGNLHVGFGWSDSAELDMADWHVLSLSTFTWTSTTAASGMLPMDSVGCVAIGSSLMKFGGWGEVTIENSMASLDLSLPPAWQRWTVMSNTSVSPLRRSRHTAVTIADSMYLYGGEGSDSVPLASLWRLDFKSFAWSRINPQGDTAPGLSRHVGVALGDRVVVAFGNEASGISSAVWSFGSTEELWSQLTCLPDPVAGLPLPRVAGCMVGETATTALMFGGQSVSKAHFDVWRFTLLGSGTCQWSRLFDDSDDGLVDSSLAPAGRTEPSCNIILRSFNDAVLVVTGGETYGTALNDVWMFSTFKNAWESSALTVPTGAARCGVAHGTVVTIVGGHRYETFCSQPLLALTPIAGPPLSLVVNSIDDLLAKRSGFTAVPYASKIVLFGGTSAAFADATMVRAYRTNELVVGELTPICTGGSSSPPACWGCAIGSYYTSGGCEPCPPGSYGAQVPGFPPLCRQCPAGFYNHQYGAASSALCVPCSQGTRNPTPGASKCSVCSSTLYCPVASITGAPAASSFLENVVVNQPEMTEVGERELKSREIQLVLVCIGVAICCVLALVFLCCLAAFKKTFRLRLKKFDLLYTEKHNSGDGPLYSRHRSIGGATTIIVIVIVATLIATQLVIYYVSNLSVMESLKPKCTTLDVSNETAWLNLTSSIVFHGFRGECTTSPSGHNCDSNIHVSFTGENLTSSQFVCVRGDNSCTVQLYGVRAFSLHGTGVLSFELSGPDSFASELEWSVGAAALPSSVTRVQSSLRSGLRPGDNSIFRGTQEPTRISLRAFPTHYQDFVDNVVAWGHHLEFVEQSPGTQASPSDFNFVNGVRVDVAFEQPNTVLSIEVHRKTEVIAFLLTLIGGISGVLGGSAVVMNALQNMPEMYRKLRAKLSGKPYVPPAQQSVGLQAVAAAPAVSAAASAPYNFRTFSDHYRTVEEVQEGLRKAGLEGSNLVIGIDYTASNSGAGKKTFGGRSLHSVQNGVMNPYMRAISAIGRSLEVFDDDKIIPCYGFGDERTKATAVFSLVEGPRHCVGVDEVLRKYVEITPKVTMAGPTSFAPIIRQAIDIVRAARSYHILLILADGQVTPDSEWGKTMTETVAAIVEASNYPLSIVVIGVGDGPFDIMHHFDDQLPERKFDNLQFVEFSHFLQDPGAAPSMEQDARFAVAALQEIPDQYSAIRKLHLL